MTEHIVRSQSAEREEEAEGADEGAAAAKPLAEAGAGAPAAIPGGHTGGRTDGAPGAPVAAAEGAWTEASLREHPFVLPLAVVVCGALCVWLLGWWPALALGGGAAAAAYELPQRAASAVLALDGAHCLLPTAPWPPVPAPESAVAVAPKSANPETKPAKPGPKPAEPAQPEAKAAQPEPAQPELEHLRTTPDLTVHPCGLGCGGCARLAPRLGAADAAFRAGDWPALDQALRAASQSLSTHLY